MRHSGSGGRQFERDGATVQAFFKAWRFLLPGKGGFHFVVVVVVVVEPVFPVLSADMLGMCAGASMVNAAFVGNSSSISPTHFNKDAVMLTTRAQSYGSIRLRYCFYHDQLDGCISPVHKHTLAGVS